MKLYTLVLTAFLLSLLSGLLRNALFYVSKYEQKSKEYFLSYAAKRFIAGSFKETCEGKGFKDLEDWKLKCKALYKLETITYEKACDDNCLNHAKWTGKEALSNCSGEVYFRKSPGD